MSRRPDSLPDSESRRILGMVDKPTTTPRLALSRSEAAAAIGISLDSFERHVQPHLRCNYIGARASTRSRSLSDGLSGRQ
jgi:hypothetical protein